METLTTTLNWTWDNLVLLLLGAFIVEGLRILGRQSAPTVQRTKFRFIPWITEFTNWFGLVVSVACSLTLLSVRDGVVGGAGLAIADPASFYPLYAVGVGAFGQSIMKNVLKGFMGMFGAYGKRPSDG